MPDGTDRTARHGPSLLPLLLLLVAALSSGQSTRADTTLVMFRHGEKPALGLGQLSCQGLNRALALPDVLFAKFGPPQGLYAPNPMVMTVDKGHAYDYIRPLATIEPTAVRAGLPVDLRWGLKSVKALARELSAPHHDGQTLFVAWEHNLLVQVARRVAVRRGGDASAIPDWDDADFDSLYVLTLPAKGKPVFRIEHEGLDGQSTRCAGEH